MAQQLHQVDASFLSGEADPAIVARLDDVVRANAASKIRNMYVRSAGGVRVRPGMRMVLEVEGRQLRAAGGTTTARTVGSTMLTAVTLRFNEPTVIPGWGPDDADIFEIDFGTTLAAGTIIEISMRNGLDAPAGHVTRLYWWEWNDSNNDDTQDADVIRKWRSGNGLVQGREGWRDLAFVDRNSFTTYTHTLVAPASRVRLWRREWNDARPEAPLPNRSTIEIRDWNAVAPRSLGSGAIRQPKPPVRVLDVTWWPGAPYLLVLHGRQATVVQGAEVGALVTNPHGFERDTGFSDAQVKTMQVSRTTDGAILSSPNKVGWRPYVLRLRGGRALSLRLGEMEDFIPPGVNSGWNSVYPPNAMIAHQGRLIVAGTRVRPNGVWFSRNGTRNDFQAPVISQTRQPLATDAFMVEETLGELTEILAIHGGLQLTFFGDNGIAFLAAPAVSATEFGFRQMAERGIKRGVPPVEIGTGKLAFVDGTGKSVWQMTYANERQGYVLTELSQVAPHLLRDPEDLIYYTGLAEGGTAALVVNGDSTIACCAMQPEGEWSAWSLWTTDELLDLEPYADGLWAITRRGQRDPQDDFVDPGLYLEVFDDECELDFAHISTDGKHPQADAYETWAAVCRMKDGSRHRIGMRLPEEAATEEEIAEVEAEKLQSENVRIGIRNLVRDDHPELNLPDPDLVEEYEVGLPFMWRVQTMPFVKRSGEGSIFRGLTKTQECFIEWEHRWRTFGQQNADTPVPWLVNGVALENVPRLFAVPEGDVLAQGDVLYQGSTRHVNLVGWREQNQLDVCGQGMLTIPSFQRTVVS